MKKIFILLVFAISLIACNFEKNSDTNVYKNSKCIDVVYHVPVIHTSDKQNMVNLRVVEIDSCEYLIGNTSCGYQGYSYMTHKGNCKYCAERRKRELENKQNNFMIDTKELKRKCEVHNEQLLEELITCAHELGQNYVFINKTDENIKLTENLKTLGYSVIIGYGDTARIKISW